MKILIACDKFKGSLTAPEAAAAIARGIALERPGATLVQLPVADGGEGTAETVCHALGGEMRRVVVTGPMGQPVAARYAWVPRRGLAVVEMSEASGHQLVPDHLKNPLLATTRGTGELLVHAARSGARQAVVCCGGSATNDGGAGAAAAAGYRFLDRDGTPFDPTPERLARLDRIAPPASWDIPPITAACDVTNPLLGPNGASRTYGPQKGATPEMVETLERTLALLASTAARDLDRRFAEHPGAGAAGGLGFGLLTFFGATLRGGFDFVADALDLERLVGQADIVIAGEGSLDAQTSSGKAPAGVARLARAAGKPAIAFAGRADPVATSLFDSVFTLTDHDTPPEIAIRDAARILELRARQFARTLPR